MSLRMIVGILAAASSAGVSAYVQEESPIVIEGERVEKAERRICKRSAPPTGTRMGARRICRTASEWESTHQATDQAFERQRMHAAAMDAYRENEKNALSKQGPP